MSRIVSFVVLSVVTTACGGKPPPPPPAPTVSTRCPDVSKADELAAFDLPKEYGLSSRASDELKAAALAAIEIGTLADRLDADLGLACARIAHDLGDTSAFRTGNDACVAAHRAVERARAKLGPKARTQLVVTRPTCLVDEGLMTKCASICDSSVPAGKIRAECEARAGRCDGNCDGGCEPKSRMQCDGVCSGTCEGSMKGTCGGRCVGKCDGKRSNGSCLGTCVGTCRTGPMSGECKGACSGECQLAAPGICDGTCSGTCSVDLADPKCAGGFKEPDVIPDCRARCDLAVLNDTRCSTPQVGFVVTGVKAQQVQPLEAAVNRSLPGLLQILHEVGEDGPKRVVAARAVVESARGSFADKARTGPAGAEAAAERQLEVCFGAPLERAAARARSLEAGLGEALAIREVVAVGAAPADAPTSDAVEAEGPGREPK